MGYTLYSSAAARGSLQSSQRDYLSILLYEEYNFP